MTTLSKAEMSAIHYALLCERYEVRPIENVNFASALAKVAQLAGFKLIGKDVVRAGDNVEVNTQDAE